MPEPASPQESRILPGTAQSLAHLRVDGLPKKHLKKKEDAPTAFAG
jgi:hypothetical protein